MFPTFLMGIIFGTVVYKNAIQRGHKDIDRTIHELSAIISEIGKEVLIQTRGKSSQLTFESLEIFKSIEFAAVYNNSGQIQIEYRRNPSISRGETILNDNDTKTFINESNELFIQRPIIQNFATGNIVLGKLVLALNQDSLSQAKWDAGKQIGLLYLGLILIHIALYLILRFVTEKEIETLNHDIAYGAEAIAEPPFKTSANIFSIYGTLHELFKKVAKKENYLQRVIDKTELLAKTRAETIKDLETEKNEFTKILDKNKSTLEIILKHNPVAIIRVSQDKAEGFLRASFKANKLRDILKIQNKESIPLTELIGIRSWKNTETHWMEAQNGEPQIFDFQYKDRWLQASIEPVWRELKVIAVVGTLIDITPIYLSKEKTNQALKEMALADKTKGIFLANVSHELRTPLNAILGYSQILERDSEWFSETHRNGIQIIKRSGEHLLKVINEILDYSKLEAEKATLDTVEFDLKSLLNEVSAMIDVRAREKGLDFRQMLSTNLPSLVQGDQQKIKQVLLNLLSNAIKFTEKGKVTITAETTDKLYYYFAIEDSGEGIAQENQHKVFEAFHQIQSSNSSTRVGTGLGLSIASRMVNLMGGTLKLESEPGKGSKFSFEIKLHPVETNKENTTGTLEIEGYEGDKKEILVLGNDIDSRFLILESLRRLEFAVIEATKKEEALIKCRSNRPDLVIIDFKKPFNEYFDFLCEFKAMEAYMKRRYDPNIQKLPEPVKILATSVSINMEEQDQMFAKGCDLFLQKPFQERELFDAVRALLNIHWKEKNIPTYKNKSTITSDQKRYLDLDTYQEFDICLKRGDIRGVKEIANRLIEERPDYANFAKKVLQFCLQFQINALRELITQYAPGSIEKNTDEQQQS
jgi:signal transduction histidine kinase/DNA-binding response OmpR family regulator